MAESSRGLPRTTRSGHIAPSPTPTPSKGGDTQRASFRSPSSSPKGKEPPLLLARDLLALGKGFLGLRSGIIPNRYISDMDIPAQLHPGPPGGNKKEEAIQREGLDHQTKPPPPWPDPKSGTPRVGRDLEAISANGGEGVFWRR